nr:glycosyltransferase family 9 protein [Oceanococcus sp. HetDA_MAG_MS8]
MAFGDALITLSVLERAREQGAQFNIIGTGLTRQVSEQMRFPLPIHSILPDKAAFNTVKERGVLAAVRDLGLAWWRLGRQTNPGDMLVFERDGIRNRLLVWPGRQGCYTPTGRSVYEDRRILLESLLGVQCPWPSLRLPQHSVRRVVINPCARYRERWLSSKVIDNVVLLAKERCWKITLIDPCGQYLQYSGRVDTYLAKPKLADAVQALLAGDLYIGPDSFFVHLAYYFNIPHFGFFQPGHLVFQPPGMRETGNWLAFDQVEKYQMLANGVDGYLGYV